MKRSKRIKIWKENREKFLSLVFPRRIVLDLLSDDIKFNDSKFKFGSDQSGLFIYGDVGSGKTLLAAHLLEKEMIEDFKKDQFCASRYKFITVPELLLEIRSTFDGESDKSEKELVDYYSTVDYLILDDLGVEKTSDWSFQTLYLIVNRRYEGTKKLIVTSNYSINELATKLQDKRITSRLLAMCKLIKLSGADRRRR